RWLWRWRRLRRRTPGWRAKTRPLSQTNLAKSARRGGRFFCFHEKNARTAAIGLSFELHFDYNQTKRKELRDLCLTNQTHKKKKDQREDRLPQNRGNVRSAADEQQKAAEDRNLRGVVASGAARAAARTGQGWIRTSEGVKPADLQSAPFGHSGTYPRLRALI